MLKTLPRKELEQLKENSTDDPNTDAQVPMQKHKKHETPRQHNFSKVSNTVEMASSESELDKIIDNKFKRMIVSIFK